MNISYLLFSVVSNIKASSSSDSNIDIAVIKDGDVSTCFSTDGADGAPFVALDYSPYTLWVTSIEIMSLSNIGKRFTVITYVTMKHFVKYATLKLVSGCYKMVRDKFVT